ncbi:MAG TPA: acyl-CoA dehydrogenase family protein [Acidimicrobiales bacterium]|nr:acyl-CoA dehydrogenase family protein [Acidimicrobiales bacterium]
MTTLQHEHVQVGATTAAEVLAAVEGLAPTIAARAAEVENGRRVPPDLLQQLVDAGCFRILLPASHGGIQAELPDAMRMLEALARADASVGWIVGIGSGAWRDLAGLPRATFDDLWSGGPDTIVAGVFGPAGVVEEADGGYRVRGRWSFASGCEHAHVLYGNCFHEGAPPPGLRTVAFRPEDVEIEDTWDALGLRGTGSHHFHVDELLVARERTCATLVAEPWSDAPVLRIPAPAQFALEIASVAVGIARGALDDVVALAGVKVPLLAHAPLASDPTFHLQLATGETVLRAARAVLFERAEEAWASAVEGIPVTDEQRAHVRAAAAWATEQATAVVDGAHRIAGSAGVFEAASALPRRLRDMHALTQHFLVRPNTMLTAGALLAGQPIDVPVF